MLTDSAWTVVSWATAVVDGLSRVGNARRSSIEIGATAVFYALRTSSYSLSSQTTSDIFNVTSKTARGFYILNCVDLP